MGNEDTEKVHIYIYAIHIYIHIYILCYIHIYSTYLPVAEESQSVLFIGSCPNLDIDPRAEGKERRD